MGLISKTAPARIIAHTLRSVRLNTTVDSGACSVCRALPSCSLNYYLVRGAGMREDSVLITGGAGFIGRALVAQCLNDGKDVTVIDNLCKGRLENLESFLDEIDFFQGDILDEAFL